MPQRHRADPRTEETLRLLHSGAQREGRRHHAVASRTCLPSRRHGQGRALGGPVQDRGSVTHRALPCLPGDTTPLHVEALGCEGHGPFSLEFLWAPGSGGAIWQVCARGDGEERSVACPGHWANRERPGSQPSTWRSSCAPGAAVHRQARPHVPTAQGKGSQALPSRLWAELCGWLQHRVPRGHYARPASRAPLIASARGLHMA